MDDFGQRLFFSLELYAGVSIDKNQGFDYAPCHETLTESIRNRVLFGVIRGLGHG